jgi:putative transposase
MIFEGNNFYHIYNRSFNKTDLFIKDINYKFFREKLSLLSNYCEIVSYCLMPNHFHLMLYIPADSEGLEMIKSSSSIKMQLITRKIGTILSSYTQAYNKQEQKSGSLFQPKTKAKQLSPHHAFVCFHYIHQNPLKSGHAKKLEDWLYSSFNEYFHGHHGLCNKNLAFDLLNIPKEPSIYYEQSYSVINYEFEQ